MTTTLLIIGMAGSGKTTFTRRLFSYLMSRKEIPFMVNLDPAVLELQYTTDIDIRDSIKYKDIMETHSLGPNGAIITCLNLFTTQIDQLLVRISEFDEINKGRDRLCILDTPGQIEIFTWSASGTIITETLAALHPTVIVYIIDTTRCKSPSTFMSNMLYACSILYKTGLPFIIVFNKIDETPHDFAIEWMNDFEKLQDATYEDQSFMSSFLNSMSLMLEEFYKHLKVVGVSSLTGQNMEEFLKMVEASRDQYNKEYKPEFEKAKSKVDNDKAESLQKLMKDIQISKIDT